jgi:hypothetical protein
MKEILEFTSITIGIIGIMLMYKFGISPNIKKGSSTYLYTTEELKERKIKEQKIEKDYLVRNRIGFLLTLLSMLISLWVRIYK